VATVVGVASVVLFGPLFGLGIAIVVSLLAIIYRSSSPRIEVLGKISEEKAAWGRVRGHPDRLPVAGVVVVRLDAPLFWANATAIEDRLLAEVENWPDTRALVLDLEATTQLDTTSADILRHLADELTKRDINLYLARVLHRVEHVLERSGFVDTVSQERHFWHSISQGVRAARRDTGLDGSAPRPHEAVPTDDKAESDALASSVAVEFGENGEMDEGVELEVLDEDPTDRDVPDQASRPTKQHNRDRPTGDRRV
jgi:anti-anti-sigma factor